MLQQTRASSHNPTIFTVPPQCIKCPLRLKAYYNVSIWMVDFPPDWKAHSNHSVTEKRVGKLPFRCPQDGMLLI